MEIKQGQIVDGIVKGIKPYGAFIEFNKGDNIGLAHIEDLSVVRIRKPEERLEIGQKVKCMVKSIDEGGRINLSYKDCLGTWEENAQKFKEGMTVKGIVRDTEKNKNGIFIELTPNLVGMTEYTEDLYYGQEVDVCIKKIIPEKRKVKLIIV